MAEICFRILQGEGGGGLNETGLVMHEKIIEAGFMGTQ